MPGLFRHPPQPQQRRKTRIVNGPTIVESSFTADAEIYSPQPWTRTPNITARGVYRPKPPLPPQRRYPRLVPAETLEASFTADAILLVTQAASFTADTELVSALPWTRAANIPALGIYHRLPVIPPQRNYPRLIPAAERTASFTADAIVLATLTQTFTTNAVVVREVLRDNFNRVVGSGIGVASDGTVYQEAFSFGFTPATSSVNGTELLVQGGGSWWTGYREPTIGLIQFDFYVPANVSDDIGYELDIADPDRTLYQYTFVGSNLDGTWTQAASNVSGPFTPDASTWYTFKVWAGGFLGPFRLKVWKRGDPEPDWQHEDESGASNGLARAPGLIVYQNDAENARFDSVLILDASGETIVFHALYADAVLLVTTTTTFTADAVLLATGIATFTADAVLLATQTATFTADAVILTTQSATFSADAVIDAPQSGTRATNITASGIYRPRLVLPAQRRPTRLIPPAERTATFTADAIVLATTSVTFTADAVILATQSATFAADAVILVTQTATFTADAVILATISVTFSADAVLLATQSATFTADAVILATATATFTADAVLVVTQSATFTADAVILATISQTFTADAVLLAAQTATFTADAILLVTQSATFSADAILLVTQSAAPTADAVILATLTQTFTADAVLLATQAASFTADAVVVVTQVGSFTADAVVLATQTATFTADAVLFATITTTFTADAYLASPGGGAFIADAVLLASQTATFTADAVIGRVGRCVWTTPGDLVDISATPTLAFIMPSAAGPMHFHMELDRTADFDTVQLRSFKSHHVQTGWEYWDGGTWQPILVSGVDPSFSGNEARYTLQTPLITGLWFRRVRAGVV